MNKYIFTILLVSYVSVNAVALTETPDSIKTQELREIVVQAQMQHAGAASSTYFPTSKQKNSASDAISLLNQMAIPQIDVSPASASVTTNTGQPVSIFINSVAATAQDLSGLLPKDVKRVEYLLNPQDPRFQGAKYVVNFIMQQYEWGGYTKINAEKWFGVNQISGSLYSKFAYKDMTFDLYADETYLTNRHIGFNSTETFHFTNLFGEGPRTVERIQSPLSSLYRNNSNNITCRALYSTDKVQVSNMLAFNNTSTPHNDSKSLLSYADALFPESETETVADSRTWSLDYNHETYISFNDRLALNVEAAYRHSHTGSNSKYSDDELLIVNNAKENSNTIRLTPNLSWTPDEHNSIMPYLHGEYTGTKIDYFGSSPSRQSYDIWGIVGGIQYQYAREKWSAGGLIGWVYANTNLSGIKIKENYPQGNVFATYSPTDSHQLEVSYNFGKTIPETYQKSPNMLQQDELMWYAGTPELKNYWNHRFGIEYLWLPNNTWQLAADSYYLTERNHVVSLYTPSGPDGTMLRQYANNGNDNTFMVGISGTAKLFDGKLVAKVRPQYWHRNTTGEYHMNMNEVTCQAQLTWYFDNFYLLGWYVTPSTYIRDNSGIKERTPSQYQIQLGWNKGNWQLRATAHNFLRSSWETNRQTLTSKYYQFDNRNYGYDQHMRFQFSFTYTFNYGKKVQPHSEVSGSGTAESAILK